MMCVFYKKENHLTKYLHDIEDVWLIEIQHRPVFKKAGSRFKLVLFLMRYLVGGLFEK